jgi:hypothetical protein
VGLGLVDLGLVGRGRCDAQCGVPGLCPDEQPLVGHQGQCGELCLLGRRLLYEVRPQREGEGLRPLCVLRHDGLLQEPQLAGAKLQFMRD